VDCRDPFVCRAIVERVIHRHRCHGVLGGIAIRRRFFVGKITQRHEIMGGWSKRGNSVGALVGPTSNTGSQNHHNNRPLPIRRRSFAAAPALAPDSPNSRAHEPWFSPGYVHGFQGDFTDVAHVE